MVGVEVLVVVLVGRGVGVETGVRVAIKVLRKGRGCGGRSGKCLQKGDGGGVAWFGQELAGRRVRRVSSRRSGDLRGISSSGVRQG